MAEELKDLKKQRNKYITSILGNVRLILVPPGYNAAGLLQVDPKATLSSDLKGKLDDEWDVLSDQLRDVNAALGTRNNSFRIIETSWDEKVWKERFSLWKEVLKNSRKRIIWLGEVKDA